MKSSGSASTRMRRVTPIAFSRRSPTSSTLPKIAQVRWLRSNIRIWAQCSQKSQEHSSMAQLNFDARQVAPDTGFDTVPAGWYNVMADGSEVKPTKNGDGAYLQVSFKILDGQFANRKLFARFNLRNASPVAQEIGHKQLSAFAHAVGHLVVADSSELHGKPLKVKVKIRKDQSGEYEDQN